MMQDGSRDDHVEVILAQGKVSDIALLGMDRAARGLADAFDRAVQHRLAEINQGAIASRQMLKQLERIVARPAPDVKQSSGIGICRGRRLRDEVEDKRRVDGCRLPGLEIGKALDIPIETLTNLLD
jgi:hypothetical protein